MYQDLGRNQANYTALSPLSFLRKAATVHPQRVAVRRGCEVYGQAGDMRWLAQHAHGFPLVVRRSRDEGHAGPVCDVGAGVLQYRAITCAGPIGNAGTR